MREPSDGSAKSRAHLGFTRTLVVSDKGLLPTGVAEQARTLLGEAGIESWGFHDFEPNPDMQMVEAGRIFAAAAPHRLHRGAGRRQFAGLRKGN